MTAEGHFNMNHAEGDRRYVFLLLQTCKEQEISVSPAFKLLSMIPFFNRRQGQFKFYRAWKISWFVSVSHSKDTYFTQNILQ